MKLTRKEIAATVNSPRLDAIREIQYLCLEALDHDTSWPMFCQLVRNRLDIETALMEPMPHTTPKPRP